jgi:hypothetical protein
MNVRSVLLKMIINPARVKSETGGNIALHHNSGKVATGARALYAAAFHKG